MMTVESQGRRLKLRSFSSTLDQEYGIVTPNRASQWKRGSQVHIEWYPFMFRESVHFVKIVLSNEKWPNEDTIIHPKAINNGSYTWKRVYWGLPAANSSYQVKIYPIIPENEVDPATESSSRISNPSRGNNNALHQPYSLPQNHHLKVIADNRQNASYSSNARGVYTKNSYYYRHHVVVTSSIKEQDSSRTYPNPKIQVCAPIQDQNSNIGTNVNVARLKQRPASTGSSGTGSCRSSNSNSETQHQNLYRLSYQHEKSVEQPEEDYTKCSLQSDFFSIVN